MLERQRQTDYRFEQTRAVEMHKKYRMREIITFKHKSHDMTCAASQLSTLTFSDLTKGALLGLLDNDGDSEVIGLGCPDELGEYDVANVGATEADGLSLGADESCRGAQEV
jgi:hypothetical protein